MTGVVYTAVIGQTDPLEAPPPSRHDVAYVCFTDGRPVDGWETRPVVARGAARPMARGFKTQPQALFPDAQWSVWMDASFRLVDLAALVDAAIATGCPIVGFHHPDRARIVDEAQAIIRAGQAPADAVLRQVRAYQGAGFDRPDVAQRVLTTTGVLFRRHTPAVAAFDALWLTQIELYTVRDQLSVDFCAWRCGLPIGYWPGHYRANPFVVYERLRRRRRAVA